jgi:PAS domain S-box-containing protein
MRVSSQGLLKSGFLGAGLLILIATAASGYTAGALRRSAAEDFDTERQQTTQKALLSAFNSVILAQRGFVITGDSAFLTPYQQGRQQTRAALDALRRLAVGEEDRQRLQSLQSLVNERLAFAQATIELREQAGFEAAQRLVAAGEGLRLEQAVGQLTDALARATLASQRASLAATSGTANRTLAVIAASGLLSLILLTAAYRMIRRDLARRLRAERALKQSERRFHALVTGTSQIVWSTDAAGNVDDVPEWRAYTGQSAEEVRGAGWVAAVHPEDQAATLAIWRQAVEARSAYETEYRVRSLDGKYRHFTARGVPVLDDDGSIREWVGCCIDIHARKEAERHVRQMNRLYMVLSQTNEMIIQERDRQRILDRACGILTGHGGFPFTCVWLADPASGQLQLSAQAGAVPDAAPLFGPVFDGQQPYCHVASQALLPGHRALCNDIAVCRHRTQRCETALRLGLGAVVSLPLTVAGRFAGVLTLYAREPGFFDSQELRLLDELAADLSLALEICERERERLATLERLRVSEQRFRELAETIEDVFWITDVAKEHVLYVSPAFARIWGCPHHSLYESPQAWLESVHAEDREHVRNAALTKQASGDYDETYRIVRPDGTVRWIRDQAFPVIGPDGRVERIVGVARDITSRRELEEQLRQSQKLEAIGRLAGGVAHDFNNLLTVILGYADLLRDQVPATLQGDFGQIVKAAERAEDLTRQLLAFSRRQASNPEDVNLNEVLTGVTGMLRRLIGEDVELRLTTEAALGTIRADRSQLLQVLLNLAVNARDAMPRGGQLTIATHDTDLAVALPDSGISVPAGHYVTLTVTDTGSGMDSATRARIFEPFFTTKGPGKGTGLGLATVHGIVQQSGGFVQVYSEPGKGSRFAIHFPRVAGRAAPATDDETLRSIALGQGRILLVEDEPAVRAVAMRILTDGGHEVTAVETATEALERMRPPSPAFDLLLTDVVLPDMSGPELMSRLLADHPGLKVLLVSGYVPEEIHAAIRGDVPLLPKPFSADTLLRAVHDILHPAGPNEPD